IVDFDTQHPGGLVFPTGWETPEDGGLKLTTTNTVDALGRTTKTIDANGNVTFMVYNDLSQEIRIYPGWTTSNSSSGWATTGPTIVMRHDRGRNYTETLTMSAAPWVLNSAPTGQEPVNVLQSLSRTYLNTAGQAVFTDNYVAATGINYTAISTPANP